jgi:tetratricopeptide (TPR) repeat protein
MLAERAELRLRGPSDPKRGFDELAAIESHLALFPDDRDVAAPARLATLAWILAQPSLSGEQREITLKSAEKALDAPIPATAGTHYLHDRSQLLLVVGRREEAIAAARAGYAKNDDTWRALLLRWSVASAYMHDKRDEQGYRLLAEVHAALLAWEGAHYGMGMPMLEFVELTAQIRFGQRLSAPGRDERLALLEREGVMIPREVVEIRTLIGELRDAIRSKNGNGARERAEALLAKVRPGDGTPLENELILPSVIAVIRVCLGDIMAQEGDYSSANRHYRAAMIDWPDDLWIDAKLGGLFVKSSGEDFDPVMLPRNEPAEPGDVGAPRF